MCQPQNNETPNIGRRVQPERIFGKQPHRLAGIALLALLAVQSIGYAQVFKTREAALADTFARCDTVVRSVLFLSAAEQDEIQNRARGKLESRMVTYYTGLLGGRPAGYAFIQSNVVRTKPATYLVAVDTTGLVSRVDLLAFYEPRDYQPVPKWLSLFRDKSLGAQLWPGRSIHAITGATLTARAFTEGVRKALATYEVMIAAKENKR